MAEIVREVASFDFDTNRATKEVNQYINRLEVLGRELDKLEKEGKDVTKVNREITQTTQQLNKALSQETTTLRGTTAQLKATQTATSKLNTQQNKQLKTSQKVEKQTKRVGNAYSQNLKSIRRLRVGIGLVVGAFALGFEAIVEGAKLATNVFAPLVAAQFAAGKAAKEAAGNFIEEKAQLDSLFEVAKSDTATREERAAAIDKINSQYKDYLPSLIQEGDSIARIAALQAEANKQLIASIAAKARAEFAQAQIETIISEEINQQDLDAFGESVGGSFVNALTGPFSIIGNAISNAVGDGTDVSVVGIAKGFSQANQEAAKVKLGDEALNSFEFRIKQIFTELSAGGVDFTKALGKTQEELLKNTGDSGQKQAQALQGSLAFLRKQLQAINKLIEEGTKIGDIEALTKLTSQARILNTQIEEAEKIIKDLLNPPAPSNTLQALQTQLRDINLELTSKTPLDNQEKINELLEDKRRITKEIEEAELRLSGKRKQLATDEIKAIDLTAEAREKALKDTQFAIAQEEIANLQALQTLERERRAALTAEGVTLEERERINEEFNKKRVDSERDSTQAITQLQLQLLRIQRGIAVANGENVAAIDKQIEELKLNLQELENEKIKLDVDIDVDGAESKLERAKEIVGNVATAVEELGGQVLNFLTEQANQQVARLDEAVARQKAVLNELVGNQSEANATQVQLERDRLDKLQERRKKAVETEQALAQTQIAVSAAVAVARAAAEGGGFASAITIAATLLSLAFGFAQARAAASQAFYDGTTFVKRGKGEKPGRDTVKAYLNEGEAVIPTQTNKKYKASVEAIYGNKIAPSLLNDFVTLAQNSNIHSLQDLQTIAPIPPSLLKVIEAEGIDFNAVDMSGVISKLGELGALRKEVRGLREELAAIPNTTYNFTERGLTKIVSKGMDNNSKLKNKYK